MATRSLNHWTQSAVYCYSRNCRCSGCFYNQFFNKDDYNGMRPCRMKERVREIIKAIGLPKGVE